MVADRSPLPVLLYNIPQCVPCSIPVSAVAELAQHPNILGIKDSSGSFGASPGDRRRHQRRSTPKRCRYAHL